MAMTAFPSNRPALTYPFNRLLARRADADVVAAAVDLFDGVPLPEIADHDGHINSPLAVRPGGDGGGDRRACPYMSCLSLPKGDYLWTRSWQ